MNHPNKIKQSRRIVILGMPGSGKTSLSVSASSMAGDTLGSVTAECSDTVVFNGDSEGYYGAIDCGLTPMVEDFTMCDTWALYEKQLNKAIQEVLANEAIKYVIVDAALPAKLIVDNVAPSTIADWGKVAAKGLQFYRAFAPLQGRTIILNCQVKSSVAAVESDVAKAASEAKAVGGERATFTVDLPKGIGSVWTENASLMLAREVKKVPNSKDTKGPKVREFRTHTSASGRFETKSRFASKLEPTLPGDMTLKAIMERAYGENK